MVLYLVGFMGSGKSTVGKLVAEKLRVEFIDLDQSIEKQSGLTIPEIFSIEGEAGFRKRETQVLLQTPASGIIATGGGIITEPKNREFLAKKPVVYLKTSLLESENRLLKNPGARPLLKEDLDKLLKKRESLYMEVATYIIQTDEKTPIEVAREVILWTSPSI